VNGKIEIREFSINDYDAVIELWQRVEGLEIAEGDDRKSIARFLARSTPGAPIAEREGVCVAGLTRATSSRHDY
jgi:hypothetical protein